MEFRELGPKRALQRPVLDDDLVETAAGCDGEFEIVRARVSGGSQAGAQGAGEITGSVLEGVDLSGSELGPIQLSDAVLRNVELSNAEWTEVTARRVELTSGRGVGWRVHWDLAWDLYVEDYRLDLATIQIGRVKGLAVFRGCSFRDATVSGSLAGVVFLDCDFRGAQFRATAAKGCDLRTCDLVGAKGLLSLRGARIAPDQVVSIAGALAVEAGFQVDG